MSSNKDFLNKLAVQFICLLIAGFLWFSIKSDEDITKSLEFYINPVLPDEMVMVDLSHVSINVWVKGNQKLIQTLESRPLSVSIDFRDIREAKTVQKHINVEDLKLPSEMMVLQIEPGDIELTCDKEIEKTLPIHPQYEGRAAAHFEIADLYAIPGFITVKGPEKILNTLEMIKTQPIMIDGQSKDFIQTVKLFPPYSDFPYKSDVKVSVKIRPSKVQKQFNEVPIGVLQSPGSNASCFLNPVTATLTLEGFEEDLLGLSNDQIMLYIDIRKINTTSGVFELPLLFSEQKSVKVTKVNPATVEVTLRKI